MMGLEGLRTEHRTERVPVEEGEFPSRVGTPEQETATVLLAAIWLVEPYDALGTAQYVVPDRLKIKVPPAVTKEYHGSAGGVAAETLLPGLLQAAEHPFGGDNEFSAEGPVGLHDRSAARRINQARQSKSDQSWIGPLDERVEVHGPYLGALTGHGC
jgi:hypothetical protein